MTTTVSENAYHEHAEAYEGYCTACKKWTAEGVEPDAEGCECPVCEQPTVLGAENAMAHGDVNVRESKAPSPAALFSRAMLDPDPDAATRAIESVLVTAVIGGKDVGAGLVMCGTCWDAGAEKAHAVAETKGARLRVYDPRRKTAARKRRR